MIGYATDLSECRQTLYKYSSSAACIYNDWLYNGVIQWLLTPYSSDVYSALVVGSSGIVARGVGVYLERSVSPVFYLDSELVIESGEGTSYSPYVLG